MSPIRIAHVVEATVGGVARHVIDLVTQLDPVEFSCTLYLSFQRPDSWTGPLRALADRGATIREIPMARIPNGMAVRQLSGWLQRDAIDIAHLHSAKAGYLGRKAAALLGVPTIYTPHAFPFQRTTDWRRPWYRVIERRLARDTARIICVSAGECEEAIAAGLPEEKLVIIPNGIDPDQWPRPTRAQRLAARAQWQFSRDTLVIGTLARLVPQKGIDLLLAAAEELMPDFPAARLAIWGDGPQGKSLRRLARGLGVPRVSFLGAVHDPRQAYAAMDIFCAPSRWEGGPYAILEAMACGLPVVASDVAGHIDYLEDGLSGMLVPAELPGPLGGALRTLLIDLDQRERLGLAAYHRVRQEFTVAQMVADTADLYHQVLQQPHPSI